MKPLLVLLSAFGLLLLGTWLVTGHPNQVWAGNGAMSAMLLFTGIAHFFLIKGMLQMLPTWLPGKLAWVYGTGVLELIGALGLLLPAVRSLTAGLLLAFFLLILPGNIRAAQLHLNYQTGTLNGPGPGYLWFRLPLQALFILWTWYFGLYLPQ